MTFSRRMKQTAGNMGVDLLLVDTGDLHDGTGLSDATEVDGSRSMPIFDEVDYDLLTIGASAHFTPAVRVLVAAPGAVWNRGWS